jgi:hypothetical protein
MSPQSASRVPLKKGVWNCSDVDPVSLLRRAPACAAVAAQPPPRRWIRHLPSLPEAARRQ